MRRDSKPLALTQSQFEGMMKLAAEDARDLFLSPRCREFLALDRFKSGDGQVRTFTAGSGAVMPGTIAHNSNPFAGVEFTSKRRTLRLINPLTAIERVYRDINAQVVLSIGPRTEMELIHLVGAGFNQRNIFAVDLISTSPWIDLGDMHALPYADNSFDIVISSWVLAYSKDPQQAVDEMLRVTKDGGIIAMGATYNPEAAKIDYTADSDKIVGTMFRHIKQYKDLLGPSLDKIYFQEEPDDDATKGAVILIARIKHPPAA